MSLYDKQWLKSLLSKPGYAAVAPQLHHPQPQHDAGPEQMVVDEGESGGAGRIEVRITRCGVRLLDADNLGGGVKWLVDALRYEKLIPDDNPTCIKLIVCQRKVPKAKIGTLIEITYPKPQCSA